MSREPSPEIRGQSRATRITWGHALLYIPAAAVTWGLHEYAHWQAGRWLGYSMWISLNQVGLVEGQYESVRDQIVVAMAGPVVTYAQACLALGVILRWGKMSAYPFLFLALWTRALAMAVSLGNLNDEATVSVLLGAPPWALPGVVVAILLALTVAGSRRLGMGWKGNGVAYLMCSLVTAAIVYADQGRLFESG